MGKRVFWVLFWAAGCSLALFGDSTGLPVKHTGAPADGGQDCSACHGPANADTRGSLRIETGPYTPNLSQRIRVILSHPTASRWGFQLTARALNDESKEFGTFVPSSTVRVYCGPDGARQSPCSGALEYAVNGAMVPGAASVTWDVEWIPSLSENGRVRLYASAVAANGNGNMAGDVVYTTTQDLGWEGSCPLTPRPGQPAVQAVVNGGSFAAGPMGLNSLITLKGLYFTEPAVSRVAGPGDLVNGKYPDVLACIAVKVNGKPVPLTYVSKDQINAQAPTVETGTADVQVFVNPDKPNEIRALTWSGVPVRSYSPAFFTFDGKSIAAQIWPNYDILADPAVVATGRTAKPGDIVILYGTGFGVTNPTYQAGEISGGPAPLRDPYTISIGGVTLGANDILYAGLAPRMISGVYQFNLRVPGGVPDGNVPVVVTIGGTRTQDGATIPIKKP